MASASESTHGVCWVENEGEDNFDDEPELEEEEDIELSLSAPPDGSWYHGILGRAAAEDRLRDDGRAGSYLVREREARHGTFSLSFLGVNGISHFKITAVCGDYYIGGRQFDSLQALIGYYTSWSCVLREEKLMYPVPPPEPVVAKCRIIARYTYKGSPDTEELSFHSGDVFAVDSIIDNDWLWVTAQKNNEKGLVLVDFVDYASSELDMYAGRPWFFGNISKQEAHDILLGDGVVGNFLIRPRDSSLGDYSLSLRSVDGVTRFLIKQQGTDYIMGGRRFDSVDAVVDRYRHEHIVQGLSLKEPLERPLDQDLPHQPRSPRRSTSSDGAFSSHSSLPSILSSSQPAYKRGYLVKKGHRNKWKRMFFVLDGPEQYLYFFENEKRTKPKGLLDLNFSIVYDVHESLFGRPNCFQVVVRALNESRMTYLCADTQDLANEWMDAIKKFCRKPNKSIGATNGMEEHDMKQLRSLELTVIEAHKLPQNKVSHPYTMISLNEVKTCRTRTQGSSTPIWNEDFKFNDLPADVTSFTINLYNRNKRSKDLHIGSAQVYLNKIPRGHMVDEWYPLMSKSHSQVEVGNVRLRTKFTHETIMPEEEYESLRKLLLEEDLSLVSALGQVCKDRVLLASTLLKIFRHEHQELVLLKTMNAKEIEKQDETSTLFRGTSLATTLMDQYMKMVAIPYLQQTIKDVVVKILDCRQSCELNPAKLEKGADTVLNLKQLLEFLFEAVNAIYKSVEDSPGTLRYLFGCLQQNVTEKWSGNEIVRSRVVSGFLFLRFICPAIMNPKICNLMCETPSATAARNLTLVAKCVQNLANLVEFGVKESFMTPVNPFIKTNKEKMIDCLDELADMQTCPETYDQVSSEPAQDLAALYDLCIACESDIQQQSTSQPALKKLVAVTEALQRRERQYVQDAFR